MTGPLLSERREAQEMGRTKRVKVPKLSDKVVRSRAAAAYMSAVAFAIKSRFNSAPPKSELAGFAALLKAQVAPGVKRFLKSRKRSDLKPLDFDKAMKAYVRKKPKSVLARYFKATSGSTNWLDGSYNFSGRGKIKIRLKFKKSALQSGVRAALILGQKPFGDNAVKINNPKVRSTTLDMKDLRKMMPTAVKQMCAQLIKLLKNKRKGLSHFSLAYKAPQLKFTSNLKPGTKRFDF